MDYYVIIPVHNEEAFLSKTLDSLLLQTLPPKKVVLVNDGSTDGSSAIIHKYCQENPVLTAVNTESSGEHLPGSKVIRAFNRGLTLLDDRYDFIVKLDADLVLPETYFEKIAFIFKNNPQVGIAGGFIYERNNKGDWVLNHPMDKYHVRGAFKAYTKNCFKAISGLKMAIGWDTVDELLAQYHNFEIYTDNSLKVKHLKPVGKRYDRAAKFLQGEAFYRMRYKFAISAIAALKMAWKQRRAAAFFDHMKGFFSAKNQRLPYLITREEGKFIRALRWKKIRDKLF